MLELHLRSGQVLAFDGRVLEVFTDRTPSLRFHVAQLSITDAAEHADGSRTVALEDGTVTLSFARGEAPACARFLSALAEARAAVERSPLP